MFLRIIAAVALTGFAFAPSGRAQTFSADFNAGLPAGASLQGNASVAPTGGVGNSGAIVLTDGLSAQTSSLIVGDLQPGGSVKAVDVAFDFYCGAPATNPPAEGFSFAVGNLPDAGWGEDGPGGAFFGLVVGFDLHNSGSDGGPKAVLRWSGNELVRTSFNAFNNAFATIAIRVTPGGRVTVTHGGTPVFTDVQLNNYQGFFGARFGIGARSSSLSARQVVDNVSIKSAIVVTNAANTGPGSLREAVATAAARGGVNQIVFEQLLTGAAIPVLLPEGALLIAGQDLTVDASNLSLGLVLDGRGASRLFNVQAGASLALRGLDLVRGRAAGNGGAILSAGSLQLIDCTFSDHQADGRGGAVEAASATMTRCTFLGNAALDGAAVVLTGPGASTLTNCTLSGNASSAGNAGILTVIGGTLRLTHCTVTDNTTGASGGALAIGTPAAVTVERCILAANLAAGLPADLRLASGTLMADGPSLIGCNATATSQFPAGPLVGTSAAPLDPRLGLLGYFGGTTLTQLPRDDSPALDAAGASPLATDQRGFPRTSGAQADLGATERGPLVTVTSAADDGAGSLRAVLLAVTAPDTRIRFALPAGSTTIQLASGLGVGSRCVEIESPGLTIDGGLATHFSVEEAGVLALRGLKLTHGGPGSAISNFGSATLVECTIESSRGAAGGAIRSFGGRLALQRCTLSDNEASSQSGAIDQQSGRLLVVNSTFSGNRSRFAGAGAISILGPSHARIEHSTFTENSTSTSAGGLLVAVGATMVLRNSVVAGNTKAGAASDVIVSPGGADPRDPPSTYFTAGANLVRSGPAPTAGPAPLTGDPRLGPLAPHGGLTETHRPLTGGAALDAASGWSPATDQRGFPRAVGTAADLGSVERGPIAVVTTAADDVAGSLRSVVEAATAPDTRIQFAGALDGATLVLRTTVFFEGRNVEIDASMLARGLAFRTETGFRAFDPRNGILALHKTAITGMQDAIGSGVIEAVDCTFQGNSGFSGGTINSTGTVTLLRCTFSDHVSAAVGIYSGGRLRMQNCTLYGNTFPAAIRAHNASVRLVHCTTAGNRSPGLRLEGGVSLHLERCIIAGNLGPDIQSVGSNEVFQDGPNLLGRNDTVESAFPAGALTGTANAPLAAQLQAPARLGGLTTTLLPASGSPAIDAAGASPLSTDQRGFSRGIGVGNASDLGAVERGPVITVTTAADNVSGSLRAALLVATSPDTRIEFAPALSGATITLTGGALAVPDFRHVALDASMLPAGLTLDANFISGVFRAVGTSVTVSLRRLTLARGSDISGQGGGIHFAGSVLSLSECTLRDNLTTGDGGGLNIVSGEAFLDACTISGNRGTRSGGLRIGDKARLRNCTISGNVGTGGSASTGGLAVDGVGQVQLEHVTLTANSAASGVGGMRLSPPATGSLLFSIVADNFAPEGGRPEISAAGNALAGGGTDFIGSNEGVESIFPAGPLVGTVAAPRTALLSPLSANGGPTLTHFPLIGSPVRNVSSFTSNLLTDQRGLPRQIDALDFGSVEVGAPDPAYGSLINVSTRLRGGSGDSVAIAGFAISGGSRRVALRVLGPTLAQFGVPDAMANPTLQLVRADGLTIALNDNWQDEPASATALVDAGLMPPNALESGLVRTLSAGTYTAVVRGVSDTAGNCLVEVYDLDTAGTPRLVNLSTRGPVGLGDNAMIAGLVIGPGQPRRILFRALGPTLTQFGVPGALQDPTVEVRSTSALLGTNDDWAATQSSAITASGLAPGNARESAIILTLGPGSYTAIVRGKNGTVGNALVEVYELP